MMQTSYKDIPIHFPHAELDHFILMPNPIHGISLIVRDKRAKDFAQHTPGPKILRPYAKRIPEYIATNPRQWAEDSENPWNTCIMTPARNDC